MNADERRFIYWALFLSAFVCVHLRFESALYAQTEIKFEKRWLTAQFFSEGANFADFNNDGKRDVVAGPFIYDGPEFTMKHEFMPAKAIDPLGYSKNFFAFTGDFNHDGWQDIFIIGFPGEEGFWYENPKGGTGHWTQHLALKSVDDESPTLGNLVGDDNPELICMNGGKVGYAMSDPADPTKPWLFHPISPKGDYQRFTHGLGFGDINGDGRMDVVEKTGWWEQPASLEADPIWVHHPADFGTGGAQMYVYDVDGDGKNDVVTSLAAHGYGLAWFGQVKEGDEIRFQKHLIVGETPEDNPSGVRFSQPHALALIDIDGDGLMDIVTGKRYWAHGPAHDPEPNAPAVLYWFQLVREQGKAPRYVPHLIDDNSGVGTQVVAGDINGDKRPDIVIGNKKGAFIFLQQGPGTQTRSR